MTEELMPMVVMKQMLYGGIVAKSIQAVAELGIADLVAQQPKHVQELAEATGTDVSSLYRLLRGLAMLGVFREIVTGEFTNTPLSDCLRCDFPGSLHDLALYVPHDGNWRAWMHLMDVLKTGKASFKQANGLELFEYLNTHPTTAEHFNHSMTSLSVSVAAEFPQVYNFKDFGSVVDVGGGHGLLLASILQANPKLRGVLFDLPSVIEGALPFLAEKGVTKRCDLVAGSFFESIPAGHDIYLMKHILHSWSDEQATELLSCCRKAIPPHGKLLILEMLIPAGNDFHPAKWFDISMMVSLGGKERTELEFRRLLAQSDFKLQRILQMESPVVILEANPGIT
ncbi:methyltransferase [Moorena producens JHB]|uniref:Methyltransferase n=1 Tax=Moorena producens (strain JHB) TaxID=1454205 RepID=A0A1D9G8K3_MOOP1|nr:methyltransferase [Moorena producens]AOY83835.1 methyltransferase [Moorena producens JHB]